ncbi:MAG: hypothetical protein WA958_00600 [Tunicatimonas sp.]
MSKADSPVTKTWMPPDPDHRLRRHVPAKALRYCITLQCIYGFSLRISPPRRSKWGDYRCRKSKHGVHHSISVNANLNIYAFLITYLHEVAHLRATQQHGFNLPPHGAHWKSCFRQLLVPVLTGTVFPTEILEALRQYAKNPRASTGAHPQLTLALQHYDRPTAQVALNSVPVGKQFTFRSRPYVKIKVRRTRALCEDTLNRKQYLILETALVDLPD